ncbi:MAG: hypothetical protein U0324_13120 [Polyangiales bacterium]
MGEPERLELTVRSVPVGSQRALRWTWRRVFWVAAAASLALTPVSNDASSAALLVGVAGCLALKLIELAAGAARAERVDAELGRGALVLRARGREVVLSPTSLREGLVREEKGRVVLRLETRGGERHDLALPDRATAERWLARLQLDPARRRARFVTDRTGLQWVFAYFFGGVFAMPGMMLLTALGAALGADDPAALGFFALLPGYWLAARSVGRVDVTVGVDGVYAGRGWLRRFFPAESIARAELAPDNFCVLRLVLRTGATHDYRFADEADAGAALARIEGVLALRAALPASVERVLATPGADTAEAWRAVFAEALRGGSYREAALSEGDLARVVAAPGVTGPQRVGAALALRAAGEGSSEATGVRVAAEALTAPQTVEALARAERAEARRR